MDEFSIIDYFFKPLDLKRDDVVFGIGDDAACLQIPKGMNLLVSTDTLVSGVHFLPDWDAYDIAYRSVMVNISDLAAMAAQPCWVTLALTLPQSNQNWLTSFAQGLKDSLSQFNMSLIGGDTTHGPLTITLTVFGMAPIGSVITRKGAKPGDIIVVSGELGAAALAVQLLKKHDTLQKQEKKWFMEKLMHPKPRIDLLHILRRHATAAIDISDGLSADLNHICVASSVGACLNNDAIPISSLVHTYRAESALDLALTGGDDYELCFTVPEHKIEQLKHDLNEINLAFYPIGVIETTRGLRMKNADGFCQEISPMGYTHF